MEGLRSSVYSRGRTSTDERTEKHLIYDLGVVCYSGTERERSLKGECDCGPEGGARG